ncbi:hypothetical protein GUITHDRAFT_152656 [Guillardia theta CCMP2712]|uniref:Uncharacterized protein n=1 Tax=Guillardia theta (strain CCMP2712) TaxID=905079 RepID=L1JBF6_GUITC|nr:hypothetical protein GUITHDRAFT_152656 [Guillardia theta CCMP2712]EKX45652.1 hypothetical protein GUITHDRAFT_152656 [Guillardia theta CCMP2712]|eukprot:XP_005832632.1 hypothetical protein GUITHDRAFT_152656 [Guillardia theta CCMP2712]
MAAIHVVAMSRSGTLARRQTLLQADDMQTAEIGDHKLLEEEKEREGLGHRWNAAHNDEIRSDNIGGPHPSSNWVHKLYHREQPHPAVRKHAHVIRSSKELETRYYPLRWLQEETVPAAVNSRKFGVLHV